MHEKLYDMKKELTGLLKQDRLLKSAVREVNKIDMIKGSLIVRNPRHDKIAVDEITVWKWEIILINIFL